MLVLLDSETPSRLSYSREGPGRQCLEVAPRAESRKGQLFACCLPCVPAQSPRDFLMGLYCFSPRAERQGPIQVTHQSRGRDLGWPGRTRIKALRFFI